MRRPSEHHLRTHATLVLFNGDEVGKSLERMHRGTLHGEDRTTAVADKLIQDLFCIVSLATLEAGKGAHTDKVAILCHHGHSLQQVFALVTVHHHATLRFELPGSLVDVEHDDIHAQIERSLLSAETGTQTVVEENQEHGFILTQTLKLETVTFDFSRFVQSLPEVAHIRGISEKFHDYIMDNK